MSTDKARELADKLHDYAHSYFIDTPDEEQEEKQIDSMVPLIERHTAAAVAEETEIKCMQLAACMTATLDREMELRAERDALKGELAKWRECAETMAAKCEQSIGYYKNCMAALSHDERMHTPLHFSRAADSVASALAAYAALAGKKE